ncbi:MAG TPA: peptidylprolyl isomerase [Gemmatimonadales bacterium]|nr:peptidylprolyl isomerase [Gemmatimonadales bacterium]
MRMRAIVFRSLMTTAALLSTTEYARAAVRMPQGGQSAAPATFRTRFETSKGTFVVEVHRDWAPQGADRFYALTKSGFFDGVRFFRVIAGFMAQFGISGDPKVASAWRTRSIPDDPVRQSNTRGMVTFATAGPNTRTTQLFINYGDNHGLDPQGFSPFGQVVEGMDVVDHLYAGYGDGPPEGTGPDQGRVESEGNAYLERDFPKLDYVLKALLVTP